MRGLAAAVGIILLLAGCSPSGAQSGEERPAPGEILLPAPRATGVTLEEALRQRRSVRQYSHDPLLLDELGTLLWACQGITDPRGLRTAPSAGALYPLQVYVAVGRVRGLSPGIYHYLPENHSLCCLRPADVRRELSEAALRQSWVAEGTVVFVIAADYRRTTAKYGERGVRYVHMEAGHAAQNLLLQAAALGLAAVPVGAFDDDAARKVLGLPREQEVLYLIPAGRHR